MKHDFSYKSDTSGTIAVCTWPASVWPLGQGQRCVANVLHRLPSRTGHPEGRGGPECSADQPRSKAESSPRKEPLPSPAAPQASRSLHTDLCTHISSCFCWTLTDKAPNHPKQQRNRNANPISEESRSRRLRTQSSATGLGRPGKERSPGEAAVPAPQDSTNASRCAGSGGLSPDANTAQKGKGGGTARRLPAPHFPPSGARHPWSPIAHTDPSSARFPWGLPLPGRAHVPPQAVDFM